MEALAFAIALGLAGCGLGLGLWGCGDIDHATDVPADVATTIDGEPVPYDLFARQLSRTVGEAGELDAVALSSLFDQFLDEQLLLRLAIERGLVEEGVDERRALAFLLREPVRASSEAVARVFYRAHSSRFVRPEQVRLRHVLISERAEAEAALDALRDGEDFAEVAARFSQGPTAHLGGDQGWLGREDLPPQFADSIFDLEPGETSKILEAEYGFQIFRVDERRPGVVIPFEEALPEIHAELERRAADERLAALLDEARDRYNVIVYPSNLPFDYSGIYGGIHGDVDADPAPDTDPDETSP